MLDNALRDTRLSLNEKATLKQIIRIDDTLDNDVVKNVYF